ncbi:LysM peptidoglycan-binding domain-containing protein [Streptomyces sp. NPDC056105]|uniref:LysM peptidoglycan-binding domain-containing protein n=1 Tax=Streptomyces sp. NPDC056105 TaxID=3345714 RepID=UPI0035E0AA87
MRDRLKPATTYTVRAGDPLWSLVASKFGDGARCADIAKLNALKHAYDIMPGQTLKLCKKPCPDSAELRRALRKGRCSTASSGSGRPTVRASCPVAVGRTEEPRPDDPAGASPCRVLRQSVGPGGVDRLRLGRT